MDNISFAQRMIGAIILLSLAIIFVPMVLEQDEEISESIKGTNIPSMPDNVATIVFQMDNEGVFRNLEEQLDKGETISIRKALEKDDRIVPKDERPGATPTTTSKDDSAVLSKRSVDSTIVTEGAATTWMVQLGSFGAKNNALALRDKLRKKDFTAFLREKKSDNGIIWQVRVGPELSVKRAVELKKELETFTGLDALVVRHP